MKIGFFDSGLGGLTILKAVAKELPDYDYEFYGDTAHLPYGNKSESEIYELTKAGVIHLFERDCILVILACNTASAETIRKLQDEWLPEAYPERRILGVIIPVVEKVIASGCKRVLMLATSRTVGSGKYHFELGKIDNQLVKIEAQATPELVPLIELGDIETALKVAKNHIDARVGEIDGVILGCTHYTVLKEGLAKQYGDQLQIFSQAEIIPTKLRTYLENHSELETKLARLGTRNIFLTEHRGNYDEISQQLLEGRFVDVG